MTHVALLATMPIMRMFWINIGKAATIFLWLYGIAAYLAPESVPYAMLARWVITLTAVAHALEALVFTPKLQALDGRSKNYHVGNIFLFGIFHTLGVRAQAAQRS